MVNIIGNLMGHTLRRCGDDIKRFLDVIKIEGNYSMEWNVIGLVDSHNQKGPLRNKKKGLGLFMGLRPMRVHAIMHRDVCSLPSLK